MNTGGTGISGGSRFAATRWSVVLAAGEWRDGGAGRRAMEELARIYWFPLYAFLRRRGELAAQAEDLVQGFFARVLEKNALEQVDQAKGRFRSFLLTALKNYAANERERSQAQKRGGGQAVLAIDAAQAEARYAAEPVDDLTPERVFERRWALTVLEQALGRVRQEYKEHGRDELFAALEHLLTGQTDGEAGHYDQIAARLGMTAGAVKVASHRLRRRYRELLRDEIGQTVGDRAMVDEEIRQLLTNLR